MYKVILTATMLAIFALSSPAFAENCLTAYGKTPQKAFEAGMKLAEKVDKGGKCLDAGMRIHILPEKKDGLFVVRVYPSANKGFCPLDTSDNEKLAQNSQAEGLVAHR